MKMSGCEGGYEDMLVLIGVEGGKEGMMVWE